MDNRTILEICNESERRRCKYVIALMTSGYTRIKKMIGRGGHGSNGVELNSEKHPVNSTVQERLSLCQLKHHAMNTYEGAGAERRTCLISALERADQLYTPAASPEKGALGTYWIEDRLNH
jgi:hypothetical protein